MTIRSKLVSIVAIMTAAFLGSIGAYFIMLAPRAGIQAEQQTLTALRAAFAAEETEVNRLAIAPFLAQIEKYQAAVKRTGEAFAKVAAFKILPSIDASIKSSLTNITDLQRIHDENFTVSLGVILDQLKTDREWVAAHSDSAVDTLYDIATAAAVEKLHGTSMAFTAYGHVLWLLSYMSSLADGLESSIATIDSQAAAIAGQVQKVETRSTAVWFAIVVALAAGTFIAALLITQRIHSSVRAFKGDIAEMKNGDLTHAFVGKSRDEIGELSGDLNNYTAALRQSITAVQGVSEENERMKESLIVTTEETSASATQISANAASIDRQIGGLDETLAATGNAIHGIVEGIQSLNRQILNQMAMVEESTASVTEMIASIDNVARVAEERRGATEKLVGTVETGGKKLAVTIDVVNTINSSVGSIREITALIKNISAQTNLLSMNAAIEAAHAGEYGRGFSVVADEIRKLAEASAKNSVEIGKLLKAIITRIGEATSSGKAMDGAFSEIKKEVGALTESLAEIFSRMGELRVGGDQILKAMTALQEESAAIKGDSTAISEGSAKIGGSMQAVQQVSSEVRRGMTEITSGIKDISSAVHNVLAAAEKLGELGDSLNHELSRFKTA